MSIFQCMLQPQSVFFSSFDLFTSAHKMTMACVCVYCVMVTVKWSPNVIQSARLSFQSAFFENSNPNFKTMHCQLVPHFTSRLNKYLWNTFGSSRRISTFLLYSLCVLFMVQYFSRFRTYPKALKIVCWIFHSQQTLQTTKTSNGSEANKSLCTEMICNE